jgi:hypothetical protein
MALRRAMACTPMASVMVRMAGNPSGIAATARPTAARNISPAVKSRARTPKAKEEAAMARLTQVSHCPNTAICRMSGVASSSTSDSSRLMRPISVAGPVATTTPVP